MNNKLIRKIVLCGIFLAIIIVMQLLKNISAYISGPVINAVMVLATLELGYFYGLGFSIAVPLLSILIAPASPSTLIANCTYFISILIIAIGNIIYISLARLGKNKKIYWLIIFLVLGVVFKWLFMWFGGSVVLLPIFKDQLGNLVNAINKIFSTLQLITGLISIPIVVMLNFVLKKIKKD